MGFQWDFHGFNRMEWDNNNNANNNNDNIYNIIYNNYIYIIII